MGYIFKQNVSDKNVGLWMAYTQSLNDYDIESIQVSFIYLGIRDYTPINNIPSWTGYPSQSSLTKDTFVAMSAKAFTF